MYELSPAFLARIVDGIYIIWLRVWLCLEKLKLEDEHFVVKCSYVILLFDWKCVSYQGNKLSPPFYIQFHVPFTHFGL